ncbi:MAG TPA: HAMP domain-containing sensor histidine kinase [Baekduia sp.]|uniref:sensor histidine kinase n=1 Tax=Baekduia sp. TaxID=2600305 RepID=UPI002D783AD5|nr:HAMP domain-containing sensor histidine kinase [Baekduia sp.]HET6509252.1 HAMP domain-containing sensor histidine kinase [Baekduia sp.]
MMAVMRSMTLRWRLAALSAGLTFVVLCAFAVVIGQTTASRIRSDFRQEMNQAVDNLLSRRQLPTEVRDGKATIPESIVSTYAAPNQAVIRVLLQSGGELATTDNAPNFERLGLPPNKSGQVGGYRVVTRSATLSINGSDPSAFGLPVYVQYARKTAPTEASVHQVRLFLLFGVLFGTGLALGAALMLSRRALAPITRLTATARDIARTGDPNRTVPVPDTDDEVAELARTFDEMLQALETSREEREAVLARQRQFVADASHELRTPLTAVLANLELLADVLDGERGEAARAALRSTQRMRRLVADLLLLARADAKREVPHEPTDLGHVLVDVASELGPVAGGHDLSLDVRPAIVDGARDELHRMALNLIQNAFQHTPDGTHVHASVQQVADRVRLVVEDDGPGVPDELHDEVFDRFVRAEGDRGGSVGLGLSIVRAVARSHGGDVVLDAPADGGARFIVTLPAAPHEAPPAEDPSAVVPAAPATAR